MLTDRKLENKWLEALRSGDYQQGEGALASAMDNTHCALGVLCEVAYKEGRVQKGLNRDRMHYTYNGQVGYPPRSIVKLMEPCFPMSFGMLSDLNDVHELTFSEIADAIEREISYKEAVEEYSRKGSA